MITGTVNAHREAVLRLAVFDAGSNQVPSDSVVDTGFDGWITLPPALVATLGLRWKRYGRALLADGSESGTQPRSAANCDRPGRVNTGE